MRFRPTGLRPYQEIWNKLENFSRTNALAY
jgi:hypothetical protein